MASAGADVMSWCVFDGSLSMGDMEIERRPYHHNCKCALHKLKGRRSHACSHQRNVSFPKRVESRKYCCFSMSASAQYSYVHNSSRSRNIADNIAD